jgi:hypothetical protein
MRDVVVVVYSLTLQTRRQCLLRLCVCLSNFVLIGYECKMQSFFFARFTFFLSLLVHYLLCCSKSLVADVLSV